MPKVIIYLQDKELNALHKLAQKEYRQPKAQAALIIRNELQRLGMVAGETAPHLHADQKARPETDKLSVEM
jgi:diadenosine tetraphosphate (Ap4A) HIT family hydrolase